MVEKIKQALERAYLERAEPESTISELLTEAVFHKVDPQWLVDHRIISFQGEDSNTESYSLLGTQLQSELDAGDLVSLGVTSANKGEGKSLTALNLAINLTKTAEQNIILIDGDLMHPSIHGLLNIHPKCGLIDYLIQEVGLSDILCKTNIPNLWVIPGRFEPVELSEQAHASQFEQLLNRLSDVKHNVVIVDLPSVLGKGDAIATAAHLDAVIFVVENGETKTDEVTRSVALLTQSNIIACVLNKVNRFK